MNVLAHILAAILTLCAAFPFSPVQTGDAIETGNAIETGDAGGTSRCLVLGYDAFVTLPSTAPCSANNAEIMTALFWDFVPSAETVVRRVNEPATADALEKLIHETFSASRGNDTCYLYLSTHGVTWEENGEKRMALMLSDGQTEEALSPERLKDILSAVPGRKVLILDACHSGALADALAGESCTVLASCGAGELSYFWYAFGAEGAGTGYFTSALESALRASAPAQIDPDGNGGITPAELKRRLADLYGASEARVDGSAGPVFLLPENRRAGERIRALAFDLLLREGDVLTLPFHFSVPEETRLEYRIIPKRNGAWDFDAFASMPDRERTGTVRGLLSPGEKDRQIRVSAENLGPEGEALLQVISLRGLHGQVPVLEGTRVITRGDE